MFETAVNPTSELDSSHRRHPALTWLVYAAEFTIALLVLLGCLWFLWRLTNTQAEEWRSAADDLPNSCDVVFAGSSLIAAPLSTYESSAGPRQLDHLAPAYRAIQTEKLLAASGAGKLIVYNGSAVGQDLGSTRRFVTRLIEQKKHPRLIVLFIAPLVMTGKDREEASLERDISMLQGRFKEYWEEQGLVISAWSDAINKDFSEHKYFGVKNPSNADIGWQLNQVKAGEKYRHRISKPKLKILAHILDICRENSIRTLVVSTPIAPRNRALFRAFTYEGYLQSIREAMTAGGVADCNASFVDLGQSPDFIEQTDFYNGTHCNGQGWVKMLKAIAPSVNNQLHHI